MILYEHPGKINCKGLQNKTPKNIVMFKDFHLLMFPFIQIHLKQVYQKCVGNPPFQLDILFKSKQWTTYVVNGKRTQLQIIPQSIKQ